MALHHAGPPSPHVPPRYATPDQGLTQFLVFKSWRCLSTVNPDDEIVHYSFVDSPELRADIDAYYKGELVPAVAFTQAGRMVRQLTQSARHSFAAWKRRTSARLENPINVGGNHGSY